ncbi:MAG: leucyl aminopeptidase [Pseudomonadota bacterium]
MAASLEEMTRVFRDELALCNVGPGEKVSVLSEGKYLQNYAEAFVRAAEELGADVNNVHVAPDATSGGPEERIKKVGINPLSEDPQAMATLKDSDLVVDLMLLLFSKEQLELQAGGTRILLAVEPFEILKRLFPDEDIRRRVEASEQRVQAAKTLRFTNKAGTDVIYQLKSGEDGLKRVVTEYGYTTDPGRWDHWPSGFLACIGTEDGVEGRVVMDVGDIILPNKEFVRDPIDMTIRDGFITEIQGGEDARKLQAFYESYEDPGAFGIAHIGWGLNQHALWDVSAPGICMDGRAYYGNVLFSTGPNIEFGGTNNTSCHFDLPMKNCSLWLDDELIVQDGELIPDDLRAPGR